MVFLGISNFHDLWGKGCNLFLRVEANEFNDEEESVFTQKAYTVGRECFPYLSHRSTPVSTPRNKLKAVVRRAKAILIVHISPFGFQKSLA